MMAGFRMLWSIPPVSFFKRGTLAPSSGILELYRFAVWSKVSQRSLSLPFSIMQAVLRPALSTIFFRSVFLTPKDARDWSADFCGISISLLPVWKSWPRKMSHQEVEMELKHQRESRIRPHHVTILRFSKILYNRDEFKSHINASRIFVCHKISGLALSEFSLIWLAITIGLKSEVKKGDKMDGKSRSSNSSFFPRLF